MMVIGNEATTPERLINRVLVSGVLKYSQATKKAQAQPVTPAMSAGVCRQTSRTRMSRMGRRDRKIERNVMEAPGIAYGKAFAANYD